MNVYVVYLTRQAEADNEKLKKSGNQQLERKAAELIQLLREDPRRDYPPVKRLNGDLKGLWARRLNEQHRLVYRIDDDGDEKAVVVVSMWTHYHKK